MFFQNLASMELLDIIIIFCHISVIFTFMVSGIILFIKLKRKSPEIKNYLLGIGLFLFLYGFGHFFMFLYELTFDPFVWRVNINDFNAIYNTHPDLLLIYDITWRLKTAFGISGVIILFYQLEKRILIKKTKYLFTIIQAITLIPALIFGVSTKDDITIIRILIYLGNSMAIVIPFIYLYYAKKTTGDTRKRAIGAMIGMLLLFMGIIINGSIGKSLYFTLHGMDGLYFTYYMFAFLTIVGILIYMKSIKYKD